jgi:hypothetical protein
MISSIINKRPAPIVLNLSLPLNSKHMKKTVLKSLSIANIVI